MTLYLIGKWKNILHSDAEGGVDWHGHSVGGV
jgi:hypothetical protein